jgi:hypothetical protein
VSEREKFLVKQTERIENTPVFEEKILKNSRAPASLPVQASNLENERSLIEAIKKIIRKPNL